MSRWQRYGQDRLYVNDDATREGVGFYDHQTGKLTLRDEARSVEVLEALRPFLGGAVPQGLLERMPETPPSAAGDLTRNRAGDAVARRAAELRPSGFQRLAARVLKLRTEATTWEAGAKGERIVDKRLSKLRRDGWVVLSSIVKRSGADIDHLVIGPPGVFTVNTKNHDGAVVSVGEDEVKVNGRQQPYLRNSRHEAASAERILTDAVGMEIAVTPVLAFVGAASIDSRQGKGDVLVVPGEDIDSILRERLAVYSIQERERILDAARRAEIWLA
ncbi:MAG TPA: nuclease-related domain-containing protein [Actinospica sp.]|nr:nuclease-related domain-containing protein [Actinospica sp.]